ncbi:MAG: hypothetical protein ACK47B_20900 [Armatimonadota bacterium]
MSMTIQLPDGLDRRLLQEAQRRGIKAEECARIMLEAQLDAARAERNRKAVELMQSWLAEPPNEEDDRWPELEEALEANRSGQRKLFGA